MRSTLLLLVLALPATTLAETNLFKGDISAARILGDPVAKTDPGLSKEQLARVAAMLKTGAGDKAVQLLDESQKRRYREIQIQLLGAYAVFEKDVLPKLKLSRTQLRLLREAEAINAKEHAKMQSFLARARFRSKAARDKYIEGFRKPAHERLYKVLSAEQRTTLKSLGGKKWAGA